MDHPCMVSDVEPCGRCLWCISARRQIEKDSDIEVGEQRTEGNSEVSGKAKECGN